MIAWLLKRPYTIASLLVLVTLFLIRLLTRRSSVSGTTN